MNSRMLTRGSIVLVEIPYLDTTQKARRPAVVVSDTNQTLDLIIAAITSRIRNPLPSTHLIIDQKHPDWTVSGLRLDSVIRCDRLFTVSHDSVVRAIGQLTPATLNMIDECLRIALGIQSNQIR